MLNSHGYLFFTVLHTAIKLHLQMGECEDCMLKNPHKQFQANEALICNTDSGNSAAVLLTQFHMQLYDSISQLLLAVTH